MSGTDFGLCVSAGTGASIFARFYLCKGVGPLLLLSRGIDRARAGCLCLPLCWGAAKEEWGRMWETCLSKAQRER